MDKFANIGKAVLTQSLGLQKNYTEITEFTKDVIDYSNSACSKCKFKAFIHTFQEETQAYKTAYETCENCPNRLYTQKKIIKKVYHNEKNKFGYRPRLKTNAIKLLLLLHFYHPDQNGIITNVDTREIATFLSCDLKTVRNNLHTLQLYSYITYEHDSTYMISLCLNDYEKYYLPANKGGRGFFVLSKELLLELLNIKTLLSLRIHLRELIELDNLSIKGPFTAISKTYQEIKRTLPDYCKPGIIKNAIDHASSIFKINFNENVIRFEINDEFNAKKRKEDCFQQYQELFKQFILDFNQTASYVNVTNTVSEKYQRFFDIPETLHPDHFKLITLQSFEIEDLAKLALQYSYDLVIAAFSSIYKSYYLLERKILNLGGLVRTAIESQLQTLSEAV